MTREERKKKKALLKTLTARLVKAKRSCEHLEDRLWAAEDKHDDLAIDVGRLENELYPMRRLKKCADIAMARARALDLAEIDGLLSRDPPLLPTDEPLS